MNKHGLSIASGATIVSLVNKRGLSIASGAVIVSLLDLQQPCQPANVGTRLQAGSSRFYCSQAELLIFVSVILLNVSKY